MHDLRYAIRTLGREPSFVAGVTLTFALAIGANASLVGLVERLMFAPPPGIANPERVVQLSFAFGVDGARTFAMSTTSYPNFRAVASLEGAFGAVAAVRTDSLTIGDGADQLQVAAVAASGTYFTLLGVRPARGRLFGPDDDAPPVGNDVVVLSWSYWQRRFAGDPMAIGTRLVVDGQMLMVIGVTPRGFNGTGPSSTDIFLPLSTAARSMGADWWTNPGMRVLSLIARLKDGVTPAAASTMAATTLRANPVGYTDERLASVPLQSLVPGREARETVQGRIALALSAVSFAVLLIATANVGTLLRLRAERRRRDLAVQVALGARPAHLARRALLESLVLAFLGATLALVLSRWFDGLIRATLLPNLAPVDRMVDRSSLIAALMVAALAGLGAGLAPLRHGLSWNVVDDLRAGSSSGSSGRVAFQHALVGLQVALSTVLLAGAGLFVRSLDRVRSQDLGFVTSRLLYVDLDFAGGVPGLERDLVHEEAANLVTGLPGVVTATVVQGMPFSTHYVPPISIPGHQLPPPNEAQLPILYAATPEYLAMMGVRLVRGRLITDRDGRGAPLVVLVNETMARTVWPGEDPIGKCVRAGHGGPPGINPMEGAAFLPCREVVGVVRDSRARSLRTEGGEDRLMQYYVPFPQLPAFPGPNFAMVHAILVETQGPPGRMAPAVRRLIQGATARRVYVRARPYQDLIDPQLRSWRLGATLFTALGALALAMATVGLYSAVSYLVAQRSREMGVRLALGGSRTGVVLLVIRDALRMAGVGAGAGMLIALLAAPVVRDMLFQTSPREPGVLFGAGGLLLLVAVGAAALPSWRASRVSPMEVLRTDG